MQFRYVLIPLALLAGAPSVYGDGEEALLKHFRSLEGDYISEMTACPSPLNIRMLVTPFSLYLRGTCASGPLPCPLTPWLPENGNTYAELFMDVNEEETIIEEEDRTNRITATFDGSRSLQIHWTLSRNNEAAREVLTTLEATGAGLRLSYERNIDLEFGPLTLICDYTKRSKR